MLKTILHAGLLLSALAIGFLFARSNAFAPSAQPAAAVVVADACLHNISVAQCPFCHPELLESLGFCVEHDVPEAICTRCNDTIIPAFQALNDWCAAHGLPESQCLLCNPSLALTGEAKPAGGAGDPHSHLASAASKAETAGNADDHGVEVLTLPPTRAARPPAVACRTDRLTIRLASDEAARYANLQTSPVRFEPITETLRCNAEVVYDANRYSRLSARARGIVREVHHDLGDRVAEGETVLVIDSAALAAAKAQFLQTRALVRLAETSNERLQRLVKSGATSEMEALIIETEVVERRIELARSEQELRNLGLNEKQLEEVAAKEDTSSLLPITASIAGELVERNVTFGEIAEVAVPLMAIADTSRCWAMLDISETDAIRVTVGNPVVLQLDALPGESFGGYISWVSTRLDPLTRTVKARAELQNPRGALRANMFGVARVALHERENVLLVPKSAVQWEGCCNVVFVPDSPTVYRPRKVRLGCAIDDYYEIEEGLRSGEAVVTQGSFLLKTEIMKGSLGAGCCEVAGPKR